MPIKSGPIKSGSTKTGSAAEQPSARSGKRILVSGLIIVHLFFVATAMLASHGRSRLTERILSRFAFYTELLNLDLNLDFAWYHLTHATEFDVDHRIEVLPKGADETANWLVLPADTFRGSESYKRYQRLGRHFAILAEEDGDAGRIARSVAEHFLHAKATEPAQVRCRRHLLQDWEVMDGGTAEERDPNSETYFRVPYAADCIVLSNGRVDVIKVEERGRVAPPGPGGRER
jgi:hypothetical protein